MTLSILASDGVLVEGEEQPVLMVIRRHTLTRQEIDRLYGEWADCDELSDRCLELERRLNAATDAEQLARSEFLHHPATTLEDVALKVKHVRFLLSDGDEALDRHELDALLQSLALRRKKR
ncbi:hypothetical protein [Phyllobacterium sophorae]|uniref:Uncharacterized protein n=1 Tax=Phyllobacterium sophorae TaxID=1520277 RepID=A0A2P7B356_9HYPH|nr:hypothetical protein [Phyllobacterium sophorae]PSH60895.1 hypothetical protein CU103_25365 [Phyllobacterium sophorae]